MFGKKSNAGNRVWMLIAGACLVYRLFGGGELDSVQFENVTISYERDSDSALAKNIARVVATDPLMGGGSGEISGILSPKEGQFQLEVSLKPGVQCNVPAMELMACVLTDECSPDTPIYLRVLNSNQSFVCNASPYGPLGKRFERDSDILFYRGDITEQEADSLFDQFVETSYFEGIGDFLQVERQSGKFIIRQPFSIPKNNLDREKLKEMQFRNLLVYSQRFPVDQLRFETVSVAMRPIEGLSWDVAKFKNVIVAYDDCIKRETAVRLANHLYETAGDHVSIRMSRSANGIESYTRDLDDTSSAFLAEWGRNILTELPTEIDEMTVRVGVDDAEDVTHLISTRENQKTNNEENQIANDDSQSEVASDNVASDEVEPVKLTSSERLDPKDGQSALSIEDYQQLAKELSTKDVLLEAAAKDNGELQQPIGAVEIIAALREMGFTVTENQLRLDGHLAEAGLYTVKLHLHEDVDAKVKVWVLPKAASDELATAANR